MRFPPGFVYAVWALLPAFTHAEIPCPPMPAAVTTIAHDVKSDIDTKVGLLGPIKAGDLSIKTDVAGKSVFERYPNIDRLLTLQTMTATYCALLRDSTLTPNEKLDRWEAFQRGVLKLGAESIPQTAPTVPNRNPQRSNPQPEPSRDVVPGAKPTETSIKSSPGDSHMLECHFDSNNQYVCVKPGAATEAHWLNCHFDSNNQYVCSKQ
jgi:hypothetical protein